MYKLLIVDDEQIVLDSVQYIVENYMGNSLLTETARSGREAIEKAEGFRPDIVIMDIKMPGISGLEAIAEIKKFHGGAIFIVATAYEKFDLAKEALHLGAIDYINKPLSRDKLVAALESAIRIKDADRKKLETELELKEKMAFLQPVLESGFIYSMIFSDDHTGEMDSFRKILDINLNGGYVMTVEFGEEESGGIAGRIGTSIRNQKSYPMLRDAIKECCTCIVGPPMLNRIITYVPCDCDRDEYERRIEALDVASRVYSKLKSAAGSLAFSIGIGKGYKELGSIYKSYEESLKAIGYERCGGIFHINDIPQERSLDKSYPEHEEKLLLKGISSGDAETCLVAFEHIFDWLRDKYNGSMREIASGLTELVVMLGRIAKDYGAAGGAAAAGPDYLSEFLAIDDVNALKTWVKNRIRSICVEISSIKEKRLSGVIVSAKEYISNNYCKEITLEDVSREVNVSPNYFSKLFKEETGSNFIDYLTSLRIEKAKKLLSDSKYVNKEICYQIGYSDPNYFSRIFKRIVGVTPTEYRSNILSGNL